MVETVFTDLVSYFSQLSDFSTTEVYAILILVVLSALIGSRSWVRRYRRMKKDTLGRAKCVLMFPLYIVYGYFLLMVGFLGAGLAPPLILTAIIFIIAMGVTSPIWYLPYKTYKRMS